MKRNEWHDITNVIDNYIKKMMITSKGIPFSITGWNITKSKRTGWFAPKYRLRVNIIMGDKDTHKVNEHYWDSDKMSYMDMKYKFSHDMLKHQMAKWEIIKGFINHLDFSIIKNKKNDLKTKK